MPKILVDADGIVYRAGFACEKTKYLVTLSPAGSVLHDTYKAAKKHADEFNGEIWSRKDLKPEDEALLLARLIIKDIRERYPEHEMELWLTPPVGNFREGIATRAKYKGNRDAQQKPSHFKAIRKLLVESLGAREASGQEADDALGIGATCHPDAVLCSFDKDLLQIPGTHYNWVSKEEIPVSKRQGALRFYKQCISGDPTDNVPGVPGYGDIKAARVVEGAKSNVEAWELVVKTYELAGLSRGDALETARLVYVRRKENEVWQPPKN